MRTESPTSLKTFQQCPRKYQATYITKELKWEQSPAAARGDRLHKLMEAAITSDEGLLVVDWPADEMHIKETARGFVDAIHKLKDTGWKVQAELETATDGMGNITGWWDSNSWLRSKIDVCATHPDKDYAIVVDFKTGKVYNDMKIQLDINALCLRPITDLTKYKVMFAYLDQDVITPYDIVVDLDKPREFDRVKNTDTKLLDTMLVIDNLKESFEKAFWPEKKNNFCNWCQLKGKCKVW